MRQKYEGSHTHNVHTSQLRPDLREESDHSAVDHVWFEEIEVGDILVATLKLTHFLDVLQFVRNKRAVTVSFPVDKRQDIVAFFPAVFTCQPTGRFR